MIQLATKSIIENLKESNYKTDFSTAYLQLYHEPTLKCKWNIIPLK